MIILLILSLSVAAHADVVMRSLGDVSTHKLNIDKSVVKGFLFFQKDCSACKQQIADVKCLEESMELSLVGAFSSEQDLRKEYKKLRAPYPGYYGDKDVLKYFKIKDGLTPQIVVIKEGRMKKNKGYMSCSALKEYFLK